jgi:hypothetical protein
MSGSPSPSLEAPPGGRFGSGVFRCQLAPDDVQSVSLRLFGELDLATRDVLRAALLAAEESAAVVTIDLAHLEFIDCAGLATLAEAAIASEGLERTPFSRGRRLGPQGARPHGQSRWS